MRRWPHLYRIILLFLVTDTVTFACMKPQRKLWHGRGNRGIPDRLSVLPAGWRWDGTSLSIRLSGSEQYCGPEFEIGGQTARPFHGGQHPVSTSALRNARSRNEFSASSHPVGPLLSAGSGRGFGVCFGSVPLLSSLKFINSPPSGPCLLDSPDPGMEPSFLLIHIRRVWLLDSEGRSIDLVGQREMAITRARFI